MNTFSEIPEDPVKLDAFLEEREAAYDLKPGTEAKIAWQPDGERRQTEYAIVYLHGFRASHPEVDPVHRTIAEKFGYNLFLSRMEEHGIDNDYPLLDLTVEKMLQSARFAFEVGKRIGKKVILMGTSTGGSLALWLASREPYKSRISSLILYSPLIRFYGLKGKLLMNAASRGMLRIVPGKNYLIKTKGMTYAEERIWNKAYALKGALELGSFIQQYMQESLFSDVHVPTFTGYYYKNSEEQDTVVSVSAIKKMTKKLGLRTEQAQITNFPEAKNHVICNSLLSKAVPNVIVNTERFLKKHGSHATSENG